PLPEAQMDRFFFKLIMTFPGKDELADIVKMTGVTMDESAEQVVDGPTILEMRELAKTVPVMDDVLRYAVNLVTATHPEIDGASATAAKYIKYGASPRAAQALIGCAKVRALINGNYNVSYDDIAALAAPVLRHRIKINYNAVNDRVDIDDVIDMLVNETKKASK
ncbi:MAG: AAA family ATPase, partial [Clostridia bacterium]|nr:AAA family ATPase [Clostridia bacterium]